MVRSCPRCRGTVEDGRRLACPHCGYALRLPAAGKAGAVLLVAALAAYLAAIFAPETLWVEVLAGGIVATVAGMVALLVAGRMIGRDRRPA